MAKTPTMQDIKKQYFALAVLEAGNKAANAALALVGVAKGISSFNFDPEGEYPAGCGMAIAPLNKRDSANNTSHCVGVCIAAIPDVATIAAAEGGQAFINDTVTSALIAKLTNAARPRKEGEVAASLPLTVTDFIVSNRPEGVLVAFNKLAPAYVKLLKSKGMRLMTTATLREVMQSAIFAEQQFPKVPQATWETILNSMIAAAEKDNLIAGQMVDWLKTRATAGLPQADEIDLADMDFDSIGAEAVAEPVAEAVAEPVAEAVAEAVVDPQAEAASAQ